MFSFHNERARVPPSVERSDGHERGKSNGRSRVEAGQKNLLPNRPRYQRPRSNRCAPPIMWA